MGGFTLLGAAHTVTRAMARVEMGRSRLLIDCGIAQGREAERWHLPQEARHVDAIVLTHGHNDHGDPYRRSSGSVELGG